MSLNATILGQAISFFIFVLFCMKYIWPPLIAVIEKRQKEISESLLFVERTKKDLEIAKEEAATFLEQMKMEAKKIIEQAYQHKAKIVYEAKSEAEVERKKILALSQKEIETEYNRAREELRNQVTTLILAGVEKIINHSIDRAADKKIIDAIIAKL
ncbi:F0F1 ATP synthase subunit B [Sodalis sp. CWE]|uniref:F0F1 ATP synthase subunit B n=1 Tax=Sodalis sp. CWE TaxID=2803816 RepID=UPI001C7D7964|nr:F0F1 ATP synthase subunit B [Sodalis sp. CWE]